MSYTSEEARRQLLDDLADAVDALSLALASLGEAYEEVDDQTAELLDAELFRPIRSAYARARRTHTEFARRYALPEREFAPEAVVAHSGDPRVHIERALDATERADHLIAEMQDSMLPVEVGDRELRDGLSETRATIAAVPARGRQLLRTIGR
jgi:hypothetical protein